MQYLGGKHYQAGKIAPILQASRRPGQRFVDLCCGALNITAKMDGPRVANDACVPLINLYRGWQAGWRPPEYISEEEYNRIKKGPRDPEDPLTAFAGFGLGYGGKYFDTYSRGWCTPGTKNRNGRKGQEGCEPVNYAESAALGLEKKLAKCEGVQWSALSLFDFEVRRNDLVYIDPPYKGTAQYAYFGKAKFDYDRMIACADEWAMNGSTVFISEYSNHSPTWEQVGEFKTKGCFVDKTPKWDKLFRVVSKR